MTRPPGFDPAPLLNLFPHTTDRDVAETLGVTRRTIQRWRHGSGINSGLADQLACQRGLHPLELWPNWCPDEEGEAA